MTTTVVLTLCCNFYCLCLTGSIDCIDKSVTQLSPLTQTEALELDIDSLPRQPSISRSTSIDPPATMDEVMIVVVLVPRSKKRTVVLCMFIAVAIVSIWL